MKKAVVIIPTYNEKGNIAETIQSLAEIFKSIKNWQMQILVVDDSSPDGTAILVKSLQKKFRFLELLINKKKSGLGGAYLIGMNHAFAKLKADLVFEFDADLSHDPKKIPAFLKKIDQGYDLVLGSRYIKGGSIPKNWGIHRKFLSIVGNAFINFLMLDFSIRDWTTGFRAIKKEVYLSIEDELHDDRFSGYTFQIGFLHKTLRKNFKIAEVPFEFKDRVVGNSKIGPEYIKNTLLYLMKVRIKEILEMRVVKFAIVGGFGALVQLIALSLWRIPFSSEKSFVIANFLSIETAIVSNFIWSNLWTFKDRKLKASQIPMSFLTFNLSSGGSILIQSAIAYFTSATIGLKPVFTLPIVNYIIDTGVISAVVGILVGMFWNFFAYSTFVWKKKK
ncbi:MAG: Glycosyltransferase [Candidatus Pacebacteria bacterium GW2011_GWF2_38_9]|nr:MAG: glycosyltransferase, dolichol-phosphate mannosyltransferase [candidate division TM6 bacterium GW2011_GWF2_28_16]KKQ10225.1 MAG: Glycosyltransferase [Candidatus Pacebacteria bacterium GW2011_GWF1_36_5]KKQ88815.1 MAG: Glycosyltransferase [Candidatus Pacebacteria bacterium GW2011_GWF2_38_9]MBU1033779.1 glycosyltransferase family 2 protein [Patescibacteria group bacterium]HAZ73245.1 glycosyltransferase family 2 protein [Candidatus Paceibacterota bacterium]